MAELRSTSRLADGGTREGKAEMAATGALLALPDAFTVVPHPLAGRWQQTDHMVAALGPNGCVLLSYGMLAGDPDAARLLEEYRAALLLWLVRQGLHVPMRSWLIAAEDAPGCVAIGRLRTAITEAPTDDGWTEDFQEQLVSALPAHGSLGRINQYQILSRLSQGDAWVTYLAYDLVLERPVLLKEVQVAGGLNSAADLERHEILREAKLTMQLQDEHIARIEQVIPREDSLYVVTEWIEGAESLREFMDRQTTVIPLETVRRIARDILLALEHAHAKGITHRNIRPENVLIGADGAVKVTNFGLAKKDDIATRSTFDLRQMLRENPYAAPEYRLGAEGHHQVDQRVDVYAVGVLIYELLTRKLPSHLDERYWEPPSRLRADIAPGLDEITAKSLRFDPLQRFSTVSALRQRLERLDEPGQFLENANRYTERQIIKRTRNSLIYAARDLKLARPVALKKVLLDAHLTNEQRSVQLERLFDEARLVSQLTHPHIVSVFDYFVEDDDGYIVMEWLEGKTLRELLNEQGPLPAQLVRTIGIQIGEALQYAHDQDITHRDIKPENIIFHQGQVTILDFGLASLTAATAEELQKTAGTARYMAPEQLSTIVAVDQRADIFSLGVLLYELLTHKYPYEASVILARYTHLDIPEPVYPSEPNLDCPADFDRVIAKAIRIGPDDRYPGMGELLQDLEGSHNDMEVVPLQLPLSTRSYVLNILLGLSVGGLLLAAIVIVGTRFLPPSDRNLQQLPVETMPSVVAQATPVVSAMPAAALTWQPAVTRQDGVAVSVMEVQEDPAHQQTHFQLRVDNQSLDEIAFLNRSDRADLIQLLDDRGTDYSYLVDIPSVSSELLRIYPGSHVRGQFAIRSLLHPGAKRLMLTLGESDGHSRRFVLNLARSAEAAHR
ncbi:MAG: serine/threonine protein kinase [Candidatus Sericytochromatia bacterium]|nr:serine/threonine protein kinase [Candidatus Sericytochromatia bacterium]